MERGGGVEAPDKGGDVVISDLERSGETVRGALSSAGLQRQLPRWAAAISGPQSIIRRRKSRSIEFGDWLARFPNPCRLWSYSGWLNRSGGKQRPSQQFGGALSQRATDSRLVSASEARELRFWPKNFSNRPSTAPSPPALAPGLQDFGKIAKREVQRQSAPHPP